VTTSTRVGLIDDIVISIVLFLVVSLRNTDGTVIQGANSNPLKPHTVRKWLIGDAKPRQESLVLLATWLKVNPEELVFEEDSVKVGIEIDFTDQEVISKYLSMNVKQKAAVSLLVDTILENAR
jgi:hypothetical protein